ncbi:AAA family ATPase [Candidatus Parabeggiatoa sp. HSG14]|uniref:AAA family ATPase n=1 Tax=Candidatus Parabeggiatoa sp. HSG14 TaxID=3055593 RepID=UPI0025A783EE|nr:AAA family ATPase [Thiotrichales bacterium HSG14]
MKIRKIQIKNYKMFNDVTIDFTDCNGKTLDTIVIAGINGSGKTSLLQLLQRLFSEGLNLFKVQTLLHKYEEEENALICDKVELELDISNDEKSHLISLAHKYTSKINKFVGNQNEINPSFKRIETFLKKKGQYIKLLYQLEKREKGFIIRRNDFEFFGLLPENELANLFKVLYFSAVHSNVKKPTSSNAISNFLNEKSSHDSMNSDGVVFPIDIFSYQKTVETHIVRLVQEKVMTNRELPPKEVIEQAISDINNLLEGVSLKTVLVDINLEQPIFKSFDGSMVFSNELSGGEKQLYYKAILFDKLRPQNSLIMVDEPETSLHPTWQQEVLKLYNNIQGNNQVILVTHSPHIIASIHPDNLFILNVNEEKKTVECFNARDKGFFTRGSEPNRIIKEIMGAPLRDFDTQKRIDELSERLRLYPEDCDKPAMQVLINNLIEDLGKQDPFIMRLNHQLMMNRRKQNKQNQ